MFASAVRPSVNIVENGTRIPPAGPVRRSWPDLAAGIDGR
jgi:hypothetical protein